MVNYTHDYNPKLESFCKDVLCYFVFFFLSSMLLIPIFTNAQSPDQLVQDSRKQSIEKFQMQFCGLNSQINSNHYITELSLPQKCEMPLGILADNDFLWYVSTKLGILGKIDLKSNKTDQFVIPNWNTRDNPTDLSQTWDVKMDSKRNIWFTDEKQNGLWKFNDNNHEFSFYPVPERPKSFGTTYPVSIAFDNNDNVYFVGIRSPSIWFANASILKNNSTEGISKIELPLSGFKGIDAELISTGSLAIDNNRNAIWLSLLSFGTKGQLLRYDISTKNITTYDLPQYLNSPVGIILDQTGNPWVTDHGTSQFFMMNLTNNKIKQYVTSHDAASNGVINIDNYYSLPYWIKVDSDNSFWFNEHIGNKIAKFNPLEGSLIEYIIPTQNPLWGCQPAEKNCGIANALQFSIGKNNHIWFSEWTENKLGMLNSSKTLPFKVEIPNDEISVKKGETKEISLSLSSNADLSLKLISSSTLTRTGSFGNSSSSFSQDTIAMKPGETKKISFLFTPSDDVKTGEYTLMLGATNGEISYMKSITTNIT